MAPNTLWTIILKIFGLYIFLQFLYTLTMELPVVLLAYDQNERSTLEFIAVPFFSLSIQLFILIAFIFKTDWLISALRLNKGITEEKLELNIHRSTVLRIAIIITGLILLVDGLPVLFKSLFTYYQEINVFNGFKQYPSGGYIIANLVKVLISYFMISSSRLIVNFIERKRKGKIKTDDVPL
jgi:hypothetical protein